MGFLISALFLALAPLAHGQASPGYVVKLDSGDVYLDLGEKSGAAAGQAFQVYSEGGELKNPVTGKSLGKVETTVAQGTLKEVRPLYAVGALAAPAGAVKPGMRVKLLVPAAPAQAPAPAAPEGSIGRQPRSKSPAFDFPATGMAVADFKGDGTLSVVLSDKKTLRLYPYPPADAKPLAELTLPGVAPRLLSLDAADLDKNGRAELFATFYNESFARFETAVLELDGGRWKTLSVVPGVVRGLRDEKGESALAVQQLIEDSTFPFSNIYPLVLDGGKYRAGPAAIPRRRVDWVYDFSYAKLGGETALLSLTGTDLLKVQFGDAYWKSSEPCGQTPNRVRWQGKLLEFHPPIPVSPDGRLYVLRNLSMLGSLSGAFGLYNGAELTRRSWDGVSLTEDWKATLGGYATGLALVTPPGRTAELAVAVVGTAGKTSVWIYEP